MKVMSIILCMLVVLPVVAMATDTPWDVVQQYYEADKNEDIDAMMVLTDFSHVDSEDLDQFKADTRASLEALAQTFDTISYTLSNEETHKTGSDAFVFYHQYSILEDTKGQTAEVDLNFVAVMRNVNGAWKITYTQPKDTFEQNFALREILVSAGEDLADYETSELEPGFADTGAGNVPSEEGGDIMIYIIVIIILLIVVGAYMLLK